LDVDMNKKHRNIRGNDNGARSRQICEGPF